MMSEGSPQSEDPAIIPAQDAVSTSENVAGDQVMTISDDAPHSEEPTISKSTEEPTTSKSTEEPTTSKPTEEPTISKPNEPAISQDEIVARANEDAPELQEASEA